MEISYAFNAHDLSNYVGRPSRIEELSTDKMSGRQIKNAFVASLQLAKSRGVLMDFVTIKEVLEIAQDLKQEKFRAQV